MIDIHVYGKLRRFAADRNPDDDSILWVESVERETIGELLKRVGIDEDEIYTIFLNSSLLVTRTRMGPYLGYQQADKRVHVWDLSTLVKDGDRVGLFGRDMATLVV